MDNVITRGALYRHLLEVAMVPDQHWAITQARGKGNPKLSTWPLSFSICGNTFHFIFRRNLFVKKCYYSLPLKLLKSIKNLLVGSQAQKQAQNWGIYIVEVLVAILRNKFSLSVSLRYTSMLKRQSWKIHGILCCCQSRRCSGCCQTHHYCSGIWLLPNPRLFWSLLLLSASIARLRRSYKKCGEDLDLPVAKIWLQITMVLLL